MDLDTYTALPFDQKEQVETWLRSEGWIDRGVISYQLHDSGWVTFTHEKRDAQGHLVIDGHDVAYETVTATVSTPPPLP